MRKWALLFTMCFSLVPAAVSAQAELDCKSPQPQNMPLNERLERCAAKARAERTAAFGSQSLALAAGPLVSEVRKTVATLSFANVPTWSDADILAQFVATRDNRYLRSAQRPTFLRRIPWMFPEDGCYARAEQVNAQVARAGKVKPHKLFAFGHYLRPWAEHSFEERQTWDYHVVPVVKNSSGEPIVFDAGLSPCRPLPWKEWLALLVDDLSELDNLAGGWGVALGDANAYYPNSLATGEPSHEAESIQQLTEPGFLNLLDWEWLRQEELGRDPYAWLGSSPPWAGYACVKASETAPASATVTPGSTRTLTATCPFGTLATGGGISAPRGFLVTRNSKSSGNGWTITARNNGSSNAVLDVRAICLTGAPSNAAVTTVTGSTDTIYANLYGSASATCTSGRLVGGGYSTSGTTSIMRVYGNRRLSSTSSTWLVSALNTTTSSKTITPYAHCLSNTNFTFSQVAGGGVYQGGFSAPSCSPKNMMGGGYVFPRASNYHVDFTANFGPSIYVVSMDGAPPSGDPNAVGYAECLTHP